MRLDIFATISDFFAPFLLIFSGAPSVGAALALLLVGKTLQTLSNKTAFGKEEYMTQAVGDFVTTHHDETEALYARLIDEPQTLRSTPRSEKHLRRDLAAIVQILTPRRAELLAVAEEYPVRIRKVF